MRRNVHRIPYEIQLGVKITESVVMVPRSFFATSTQIACPAAALAHKGGCVAAVEGGGEATRRLILVVDA